ncbi:FMN-binding negative transcriptional regulator [Serratia marcescens]
MFQPAAFCEDDLDAQLALVRAHPLGLLVSHGEQGLTADLLPFLADVEQGQIRLRAHLSRANEHWRRLQQAAECLVIFQGLEGYVSPGWYPSKRQTGKVVPTWNYSMVQLYGVPTVMDDPAWLRRQLIDLTAQQEGRRPAPWRLDDAPANYIAAQLKGIVGIEIAVTRREGKWKMSQNRSADDADGVIAGLREGDETQRRLAAEVERRRG